MGGPRPRAWSAEPGAIRPRRGTPPRLRGSAQRDQAWQDRIGIHTGTNSRASTASTPLANIDEIREALNEFIEHTNRKFDRFHSAMRSNEDTLSALVDAHYANETKVVRVNDKLVDLIDVSTTIADRLEGSIKQH